MLYFFQEVIELSDDVSIILVLPTPQAVCFLETSQVGKSYFAEKYSFQVIPPKACLPLLNEKCLLVIKISYLKVT
jgi:hypothetical protein